MSNDKSSNPPIQVLVIDDDAPIRESLKLYLEARGMEVHCLAQYGEQAKKLLQGEAVAPGSTSASGSAIASALAPGGVAGDRVGGKNFNSGCEVVLLDLYLGAQDGAKVLTQIRELDAYLPVIMISGQASVGEALNLTRSGAFDVLEKPLIPERLELTVRNAAAARRLRVSLRRHSMPVAASKAMLSLLNQAERYAWSPATVLIRGESGSGKDVLARCIHDLSPRAQGPYLALNCAALPRDLIESELFGHARGAFTGASHERIGLLASAAGGTLFLDEIAELPLELQAKFLRFLESGEFQRLGDSKTYSVSLRIIAATHQDLEQRIEAGSFRRDLYYRLNVLSLYVPPLRERREDIPVLLHYFFDHGDRLSAHASLSFDELLSPDLLEALLDYAWPGNVRELRNAVERMAALYRGQSLQFEDLDLILYSGAVARQTSSEDRPRLGANEDLDGLLSTSRPLAEARDLLEIAYLKTQLSLHGNSVARTAEALGLLPNNLSRRLRILGIHAGAG